MEWGGFSIKYISSRKNWVTNSNVNSTQSLFKWWKNNPILKPSCSGASKNQANFRNTTSTSVNPSLLLPLIRCSHKLLIYFQIKISTSPDWKGLSFPSHLVLNAGFCNFLGCFVICIPIIQIFKHNNNCVENRFYQIKQLKNNRGMDNG